MFSKLKFDPMGKKWHRLKKYKKQKGMEEYNTEKVMDSVFNNYDNVEDTPTDIKEKEKDPTSSSKRKTTNKYSTSHKTTGTETTETETTRSSTKKSSSESSRHSKGRREKKKEEVKINKQGFLIASVIVVILTFIIVILITTGANSPSPPENPIILNPVKVKKQLK